MTDSGRLRKSENKKDGFEEVLVNMASFGQKRINWDVGSNVNFDDHIV